MKFYNTVACIRNCLWFQNNLYFHLYSNLTVLEPNFGNMIIIGKCVEYLNTQQEEKEKDSYINVKVLLNTAQKIRFN